MTSQNFFLIITEMRADIYRLALDCSNSIADALELLQSCTKPSIYRTPANQYDIYTKIYFIVITVLHIQPSQPYEYNSFKAGALSLLKSILYQVRCKIGQSPRTPSHHHWLWTLSWFFLNPSGAMAKIFLTASIRYWTNVDLSLIRFVFYPESSKWATG